MQFDSSLATLQFEFEFSSISDRIMRVDAEPLHPVLAPQAPGCYHLEFPVILPTTVNLRVSGKQQHQDTILDHNGNIVEDLFVKVKNFSLDQIPVDWFILDKIMLLKSESQQDFYTSYVGFNGELIIQLDQTNIFDQIMTWRRVHGS